VYVNEAAVVVPTLDDCQYLNTVGHPEIPQYWFAVKVCVLPTVQLNVCDVVIWFPSTVMEFSPDGTDAMVIETAFRVIRYTAVTVSPEDGTV
jgi:hypothetical protein